MTDRDALLRAVCEDPDNDTPRLAFADWCAENGDEARAEFIRVQVQFAALHWGTASTTSEAGTPFTPRAKPAVTPDPQTLRKQERAIWAKHKDAFRAELPEIAGVAWFEEFHRGFVEIMTISSDAQLVRYADKLFTRVPILHLTVTRFTAVAGFEHLPHLRRLRTLTLTNRRAGEAIVRRFMLCAQLPESVLIFTHFMPLMPPGLQDELRTAFGDRIWIQ